MNKLFRFVLNLKPSHETTPIWHGFLMIKLAALLPAAGLNPEPLNAELYILYKQ